MTLRDRAIIGLRKPSQQYRIALLSAALLILFGVTSAWAHRPYFTQIERVVLPNGESGEIRLLHGDGIIGPDQIRVLLLDSNHRIIARSYESTFFRLACQSKQCRIFDFNNRTILELDPTTFRTGSFVPSVGDPDRDKLWPFSYGGETWGFRSRRASLSERMTSNLALLMDHWIVSIYIALLGGLAGLVCIAGWRREALLSTRWVILSIFLRVLLGGTLAVLSLFLSSFGLTLKLWFSVFILGFAIVIGWRYLGSRNQVRFQAR